MAFNSPAGVKSLQTDARENTRELTEALRSLRDSTAKQTDVSLSLAKHVIATEAKDKNFIFSPISMHVVMCMIASGSGGPTRDQLLSYLQSNSVDALNSLSSQVSTLLFADGGPLGGPRLSFANGIWVDRSVTVKPSFKEIIENDYKAASNQVDFQNKAIEVREEVNKWAEKETKGLIKDLLPPGSVKSTTKLILSNALYFKGDWAEKFDAALTKDKLFFLLNGSSIRGPFMSTRKDQYIRAFNGFKVLRLPYEQGQDARTFSMLIYLPDARDGLPALVEKIGSTSGFIENHIPYKLVPVGDFRIPKFKINFGFEASKVLKGQGLVLPFSPDAGLTEMVESALPLFVSAFFHKSFIEIDEQGTEAAAASAAVCGMTFALFAEMNFVADHPFLFVIREETSGGVLFVGQIVNPFAG